MTTIISISNLITQNYPKYIINNLLKETIQFTQPLKTYYPNYEEWFLQKQIPGLYQGTRDIFLSIDQNKIIGIANVKNEEEKKICTLYITPSYQRKKEGTKLLKKCFTYLNTNAPVISIPSIKIPEYLSFIQKYNWQLSEIQPNRYQENSQEFLFNTSPTKILHKKNVP